METIWTIEELDQQIKAFKDALIALSTSQEYMVNGKRLVRADLPEIRNTLDYLAKEKSKLTGSRPHVIVSGRPCRG